MGSNRAIPALILWTVFKTTQKGTVTVNEKANTHSPLQEDTVLPASSYGKLRNIPQPVVQAIASSRCQKKAAARFITLIAAVLAMIFLLAGCGTGSNTSSRKPNQTITIYGCEPAKPLVPSNSYEQCGDMPASMMFVGLTVYDMQGRIHNEIAQSLTSSDENRTWTIKLKKWKFQDGTPVTARSFTRAWDYAANPVNAQVTNNLFSIVQGYDALTKKGTKKDAHLSGVSTPDDHTIIVHLNTPTASFPYRIGFWAWAPLPDSFYKNPRRYGQHPIGTGPYRFVSWTHNQSIHLRRDPNYHGFYKVHNDGLIFKEYTDPNAAYSDVQAGNLDAMGVIPTEATKTYLHDKTIVPYNGPGTDWESIAIPETLAHFHQDREGRLRRQAMSMAIDRNAICQKVLGGTATPATDFVTPIIAGHVNRIGDIPGSENLVYNPAKAKKLWAQANKISPWKKSANVPLFFNTDTGGGRPVFLAVANSLSNVLGIHVTPRPVPTYQDYLTREQTHKLPGLFRDMWSPDYPHAENLLTNIYASWAIKEGANRSLYNNKDYDNLLRRAAEQTDQNEAIRLYHQAEQLLFRDMPEIPLYSGNSAGAHTKDITGFAMNWSNQIVYPSLRRK